MKSRYVAEATHRVVKSLLIACLALPLTLTGCDDSDKQDNRNVNLGPAGMRPSQAETGVARGFNNYYGEVRILVQSSRDGRPLQGVRLDVDLLKDDRVVTRGTHYTDEIGFQRFSITRARGTEPPYDRVRTTATLSGFLPALDTRAVHWRYIGPQETGGAEWRFDLEVYLNMASQ